MRARQKHYIVLVKKPSYANETPCRNISAAPRSSCPMVRSEGPSFHDLLFFLT